MYKLLYFIIYILYSLCQHYCTSSCFLHLAFLTLKQNLWIVLSLTWQTSSVADYTIMINYLNNSPKGQKSNFVCWVCLLESTVCATERNREYFLSSLPNHTAVMYVRKAWPTLTGLVKIIFKYRNIPWVRTDFRLGQRIQDLVIYLFEDFNIQYLVWPPLSFNTAWTHSTTFLSLL